MEQNLLLLKSVIETKDNQTFEDKLCYVECCGEICIHFPWMSSFTEEELFRKFDDLIYSVNNEEEEDKIKFHAVIFCYRLAKFRCKDGATLKLLTQLKNNIQYLNFTKEKTLKYYRLIRELRFFASSLEMYQLIFTEGTDLWMNHLWS